MVSCYTLKFYTFYIYSNAIYSYTNTTYTNRKYVCILINPNVLPCNYSVPSFLTHFQIVKRIRKTSSLSIFLKCFLKLAYAWQAVFFYSLVFQSTVNCYFQNKDPKHSLGIRFQVSFFHSDTNFS